MAKSALVDAVLEDYLQAHPGHTGDTAAEFCEFMTQWLANKSVVGVGHSASGLALRLADGSEIGLLDTAPLELTADTPAVALTRGGVSARQGISGGDTSVRITNK